MEVWQAIKPGSTYHFSLKCPVPSQEYGSYYQIVRFLSMYFGVFLFFVALQFSWVEFNIVAATLCYVDFDYWTWSYRLAATYILLAATSPLRSCYDIELNPDVLSFSSYSWCVSLGFSLQLGFVFSQSMYEFWTPVYYNVAFINQSTVVPNIGWPQVMNKRHSVIWYVSDK